MNKTINILHLEDLPSDATFINNALIKSKILYRGLTVDSKDKFIAALTEFSPDIILADHSLPSFNSVEALKILKQTELDIPFIIVTAAMSDEAAVELIIKGADDYILKDRLSRLPLAIFNALEKFRLKKEHQFFLDTLIKSEKRYRALIEHSSDGVVILDAQGKPTYVSTSVTNVLGYDPKEILEMNLFTLMHPDDIPELTNMLEKILAHPGETMPGHTGRMLHKNGSWRWIEATVTNLLNDPAINGIVDNFRDVTARKEAQDSIVGNEHKFRMLVENSKDGMAILSETGKPSYVSPSIVNVLGYTAQEGMELDLLSLAHPDDSSGIVEIMKLAVANPGVAIPGEAVRMKHKNGDWRWIEGVITNMLHDSVIKGFVDNFRDVTQKKLSDQVIADSEEKYRLLFETSMDGILLTLHDGQILEANQAACDIFQMSKEEIILTGRLGLVDLDDPRLDILLQKRYQTGSAVGEIFFKRKDGTRFPGEISSTVFKNANGNEKTSMIIRDVTNRKHAEQLLIDSEEFNKGILASLSSHICVIDNTGTLIAVNKAWDDFAKTNGAVTLARTSIGSNYFEVCDRAILEGDIVVKQALEGILSVFNHENEAFEMEYRCDSLIERRWFILQVKKFGNDDSKAVISHQNITELKNAGQKLQLSEYSLKQAQSIAKIGSWEIDLQTLELTWSEQIYHIFETSTENFTPSHQSFLAHVHPDDRMLVDKALHDSVKQSVVNCLEHRIITSGGSQKTVEERWSVLKNDRGSAVKLVGTCQDITLQKISAEAIIRSEANLNAIIENTDSFIYSLDKKLDYVAFNSALCKSMKGNYGVDLAVGDNVFDFIDRFEPKTSEEWKGRYKKALSGEIVKFEKEFTFQGSFNYTRFSIYPIWENDNVIGLSCFVDDITKQKEADQQDRFKANLLNTIGQAVIATDLNGVINYWNKAAEHIYQFETGEALGKNIYDLTPSMATRQQIKEILIALRKGQTWTGEFKVRKKDGTYFPALLNYSPVYNQHQQLSGIIGVSNDITEKKALERLLDKATTMARIGSYEADLVNNLVFWSPMTKQIHEVDEDFIPETKSVLDFFKPGYSKDAITAAIRLAA